MSTAHSTRFDGLGFDLVNELYGDKRRTVARVQCAGCEEHIDIPIGGKALAPELMVQKARHQGWLLDQNRRSRNRCPACQGREPKNTEPSPDLTETKTDMSQPSTTTIRRAATTPSVNATSATSASVVSIDADRRPTADQRSAIRHLLETHFDEDRGMYLDGQTDQTIAEKANVPRRFVEQIREAAYGAIRITPEVSKLQGDLAKLNEDVKALSGEVDGLSTLLQELKSRQAELQRRLDNTLSAA